MSGGQECDSSVESAAGGWGRWQAQLALMLALPVMLTGLYGTNYVFLAAHTPHRCHVPECEGNISHGAPPPPPEQWQPDWAAWALPVASAADAACRRHSPRALVAADADTACHPHSFDNTTRQECDNYVYQFHVSIVPEFDLACQEWKRSLVGTVHNVGMLISLPIMGYVSDRYGRRAALITSGVGAGVLGLCKSFVASYHAYLFAEFIETVLGASVYPSAFVLMIEWLGVEQRILASLVLGIPLAGGAALLALLDYMAGYWRVWARIAYPPSFLLLAYPWLLPESVRWLVTRGRLREATAAVRRAARVNKRHVPEAALQKMLTADADPLAEKAEVAVQIEDESLFRAFFNGARARIVRRATRQLRAAGGGRTACAARQHVAARPHRPPATSHSRVPVHGYSAYRYPLPSSGAERRRGGHGAVPGGEGGRDHVPERALRVQRRTVPDARAPPPARRLLHAGPPRRHPRAAHAAAGVAAVVGADGAVRRAASAERGAHAAGARHAAPAAARLVRRPRHAL
ncbi:solute carrier family 22 member 7-like isoform X2 [Hyposmocoma kahamanoa]|uniref:solute carrier family 22 member 7-like isoform X2 n=1 Tax=Hyposmocoma kahamanoa TaxID=1477025 RepID=UPI000E6D72A7|nr:solute carrier family 22 member 7-like isoform X2 [Hyposmocoma kahamanoa]